MSVISDSIATAVPPSTVDGSDDSSDINSTVHRTESIGIYFLLLFVPSSLFACSLIFSLFFLLVFSVINYVECVFSCTYVLIYVN